jgi:hypothetical protein
VSAYSSAHSGPYGVPGLRRWDQNLAGGHQGILAFAQVGNLIQVDTVEYVLGNVFRWPENAVEFASLLPPGFTDGDISFHYCSRSTPCV